MVGISYAMTTIQPSTLSGQDDFDVTFKIYAGRSYRLLTLSQYLVDQVITPGELDNWTDVTESVVYNGSLTLERVSSSIRMGATLNGINYDKTYFGPGQAILCLWHIAVNGVQNVPYTADYYSVCFLGHIIEGGHEDDYKHGARWTRSLGGADSLLQRSTAPRLAAGRVNLLSNATVTASSTLLVPASEAGTGEFAGALVNVDPENVIDNNINTLWIANDSPHVDALAEPVGDIYRVFFSPVAGYDVNKLWWFEVQSGNTWFTNEDDVFLRYDSWEDRTRRVIICANKPYFEAYFGSEFAVDEIIDARTLEQGHYHYDEACNPGPDADPPGDGNCWEVLIFDDATPFTLNPTAGWIQVRDSFNNDPRSAVAWNQDGSNVDITGGSWGPGVAWDAGPSPAINVSTILAGSGLVHETTGSVATNWAISPYMVPGENPSKPNTMEWLLFALEPQSAALTAGVSAGATSITLSSTMGLLDTGSGICESDAFTYTGRTATTLTGIPATGANALGAHLLGAQVYQTLDGVTQYGWPCTAIELLRPSTPGLAVIMTGRIYFVSTILPSVVPGTPETVEPEDPDDAANLWKQDYDANFISFKARDAVGDPLDYGSYLIDPGDGPRWIQYVLVIFDEMSDLARARLNEAKLYLAQTQIDNSGLGNLDTLRAGALARYLLGLSGITSGFTDYTFGSTHRIGEHATGIMPYPRVLDDLARITGCCIDWGLAGEITWNHDMWWPMGMADAQLSPAAILDSTCLQDTVQYKGTKPDEVGVRIHARTPDGLHQYDSAWPRETLTSQDQFVELDDLVITDPNVVEQLAQTLYYKYGLNYASGMQEITFNVKGAGHWLRPEQYVRIPCVASTGEVITWDRYVNYAGGMDLTSISWLIESVTWEWGLNDKGLRTWKVTTRGRRFWRV
jgi:hypothetical protein